MLCLLYLVDDISYMKAKRIKYLKSGICLTAFLILFFSCKKDKSDISFQFTPYTVDLPEGFPTFATPEENQLSEERIALGKKLFF